MNDIVRPPRPLWHHPASLGVVALLLMVGGYNLSTWRPPPTRRIADLDARLQEIRSLSDDPDLNHRLDRVSRNALPTAPLELPGRLILFGGIALFGIAAVRMARAPSPEPSDESGEEEAEPSRPLEH